MAGEQPASGIFTIPDVSICAGALRSISTNRATSPNTNVTERDNQWDAKIAP